MITDEVVILVDGDACPVKDEIFRVADRYQVKTFVVANRRLRSANSALPIEYIVVGDGLNEADDWIVEHVNHLAIAVTNDVPLAYRVVERAGLAISSTGKTFDRQNVGQSLAQRNLAQELREAGISTSGPPPIHKRDRSNFLQALDRAVKLKRNMRKTTI